jgi:hypothetical protein
MQLIIKEKHDVAVLDLFSWSDWVDYAASRFLCLGLGMLRSPDD